MLCTHVSYYWGRLRFTFLFILFIESNWLWTGRRWRVGSSSKMYPCAQINTMIRGPCRVWVKCRCNTEKTNICPSLQSHFQAVITLSAFTDQYLLICHVAQALQGFDCAKPHGRTPVPVLSVTAIKCEELNIALFPRLPRSDLILDSEGTVLFGLPKVLQTVPQRWTEYYFPKRL